MANQGNDRNREGNLGQSGQDRSKPAGTSGRQDRGNRQQGESEGNRQSGEGIRRNNADEDDDSSIGTRNTNR